MAVIRKIVGLLINLIIDLNIVYPIAVIISLSLKKVPNGTAILNGKTILALNPARFRGDLEALAEQGFTVYKMPFSWQGRFLHAYRQLDTSYEFNNPQIDSSLYKDRIRLQNYLQKLLAKLFADHKIDCIIGAAMYYKQDIDWGQAAEKLGFPYIVLHRENLVASKGSHEFVVDVLRRVGTFGGAHIVTHNENMKSAIVESQFAPAERISALGAQRMDNWIARINAYVQQAPVKNHRITLFSFIPSAGLSPSISFDRTQGVTWGRLYEDMHLTFIEIAHENPDIEVVIKPKWGENWSADIKQIAVDAGLDPEKMPNLKIDDTLDAQDLILHSDVISGWVSTTMLEGCIAKKPVVFPLFDEAAQPEFQKFVYFYDALEMFQVARSKEEYKQMIMDEYRQSSVTEEMMTVRKLNFERHVSSVDADAAQKYTRLIAELCEQYQQKRLAAL